MNTYDRKISNFLNGEGYLNNLLVIDGEWGVGKTYILENYFKNNKNFDGNFISLSGISSKKEIEEKIILKYSKIDFQKMTDIFKLNNASISNTMFNYSSSLVSNIIDNEIKKDFNKNKKNKMVFILDDFERALNLDLYEILEYINENNNFKFILVLNSKKLKDYKKFIESLDKLTFNYINVSTKHQNEVIKIIIEEFNKNYKKYYYDIDYKIIEKFLDINNIIINFRELKYCLMELNNIYEEGNDFLKLKDNEFILLCIIFLQKFKKQLAINTEKNDIKENIINLLNKENEDDIFDIISENNIINLKYKYEEDELIKSLKNIYENNDIFKKYDINLNEFVLKIKNETINPKYNRMKNNYLEENGILDNSIQRHLYDIFSEQLYFYIIYNNNIKIDIEDIDKEILDFKYYIIDFDFYKCNNEKDIINILNHIEKNKKYLQYINFNEIINLISKIIIFKFDYIVLSKNHYNKRIIGLNKYKKSYKNINKILKFVESIAIDKLNKELKVPGLDSGIISFTTYLYYNNSNSRGMEAIHYNRNEDFFRNKFVIKCHEKIYNNIINFIENEDYSKNNEKIKETFEIINSSQLFSELKLNLILKLNIKIYKHLNNINIKNLKNSCNYTTYTGDNFLYVMNNGKKNYHYIEKYNNETKSLYKELYLILYSSLKLKSLNVHREIIELNYNIKEYLDRIIKINNQI